MKKNKSTEPKPTYMTCPLCGKKVKATYWNYKMKKWLCEKCFFTHQGEGEW